MENITPPYFIVNPPEGRGDTERGLEGVPHRGGVLVPFYRVPLSCLIYVARRGIEPLFHG